MLERLRLVRVELLDAARRQRRAQPLVGLLRERRVGRRDRRQPAGRRDDGVRVRPAGLGRRRQPPERLLEELVLVAGDDG